jgi:hypothetical protein
MKEERKDEYRITWQILRRRLLSLVSRRASCDYNSKQVDILKANTWNTPVVITFLLSDTIAATDHSEPYKFDYSLFEHHLSITINSIFKLE